VLADISCKVDVEDIAGRRVMPHSHLGYDLLSKVLSQAQSCTKQYLRSQFVRREKAGRASFHS